MELTVRARRRAQDAVINLRERIAESDSFRQQQADMRRQRMTCAENLRAFSQTQDWTSGMGVSPSGRFQVIEEARPKQKIISREGLRIDAVRIILAVLFLVFTAIILADVAAIGTTSRAVGKLDKKIASITEQNETIQMELARQAEDVSVCADAVKLNLISGYGAQTIKLTVPETTANQNLPGSGETGRISASTGD